MDTIAAALGVSAAAVVSYRWLRRARDRRAMLVGATVAIGVLLSLHYRVARRLSALLFLLTIALAFAVWRLAVSKARRREKCAWGVAALVVGFVAWKAVGLQAALYRALHLPTRYLLTGAWLGGSYVLFRLIHVLIEARKPGFPERSFGDFLLYVLFPSTLVAGPIARWPDFAQNEAYVRPRFADVAEGGRRIVVGIFKKFVVADFIANLPIDFPHAGLTTARMWASLYLFGFQLFFDFAGYSDIAIGAAGLIGFVVPENFHSPFIQADITRFWQSWHATLSGWMRDYLFFPLGRALRRRAPGLPAPIAVLVCQIATMVMIGLWHGLFLGYALWGVWHGIGLFLHREWGRIRGAGEERRWKPLRHAGATFLTFQFVMVGFVFFYGTSVSESLSVLARLVGR